MENNRQTAGKSTSDYEEDFLQLWRRLTRNQQRFAVAMLEFSQKAQAAVAVGLKPDTVYRWPDIVDKVIDMLMEDAATVAYNILEDSVAKAAMIKRDGLDSDDEKIRQTVSDSILDRILGRPTQRQELTGKGGAPIPISIIEPVKPKGDDGE